MLGMNQLDTTDENGWFLVYDERLCVPLSRLGGSSKIWRSMLRMKPRPALMATMLDHYNTPTPLRNWQSKAFHFEDEMIDDIDAAILHKYVVNLYRPDILS